MTRKKPVTSFSPICIILLGFCFAISSFESISKTSQIKFLITLDKDKIPEKITWNAEDNMGNKFSETKSISLSLWDHEKMNTLKIDLWTKDMKVKDMKRFYIDCIGGIGQSVLKSTGDEYMSKEVNKLCDKLIDHLKNNDDNNS